MANFVCNSCKKEHTISSYRMKPGGIYLDKYNKPILCSCESKTELSFIEKPWDGKIPNFGKFSSMSMEGKKEMLKKRSHEHFKKEIQEKKSILDKRKDLNTDI